MITSTIIVTDFPIVLDYFTFIFQNQNQSRHLHSGSHHFQNIYIYIYIPFLLNNPFPRSYLVHHFGFLQNNHFLRSFLVLVHHFLNCFYVDACVVFFCCFMNFDNIFWRKLTSYKNRLMKYIHQNDSSFNHRITKIAWVKKKK